MLSEVHSIGARSRSHFTALLLLITISSLSVAGCAGLVSGKTGSTTTPPPPDSKDTTPPTVTLTSPAAGSTLSGKVNVTAAASDNVSVARVQFKVDGANSGAAVATAPYALLLDSTTWSNGS